MIALVLAMLRARAGRAVVVWLLTVVAVAAAVAGPVFLDAADRSTIAAEVAHATPFELSLQARDVSDLAGGRSRIFETTVPRLLSGPGLTPMFAAEFGAYLNGPNDGGATRLAFREGVCAHLRMVEGRCPVGANELILGQAAAATLGVHSGQSVVEHEAFIAPREGPVPVGPPATLTVVGVFQSLDPADRYWADEQGGAGASGLGEPVFTTRGTIEALGHRSESQKVTALLDPAVLTPSRLAEVRATVASARTRATDSQVRTDTGIPALLDRIAADRSTMREVVPLAAAPLVVLAWMVLLLAAGHAADARRSEVALLKLRGTGNAGRSWLVLGETLLAVLVGAPLGYLVGYVVVGVAARLLLPAAGSVVLTGQALKWGAVALLGAMLVTLLAQRRPLTAPVADLLRQVPNRGGWRGHALEAMLYPIAAAAVVQMWVNSGRLTGVTLLAPGLVVLAVALLAARLVGPVVNAVGRRALRRGRLGVALGALQLARRPGAPRLLALLVVAVAQLCFAVTAATVAKRATTERVTVELGAAQVLTVLPVEQTELLRAVRAADPTGRYAMAVASVPALSDSDPPMLAVDATRLAHVAKWLPESGTLTAAQVADRLRPGGFDPILVHGRSIAVDMTATSFDRKQPPHLVVHLAPVAGGPIQATDLGVVVSGRHRYSSSSVDCPQACRLVGVEVALAAVADFDLVVHGLYQGDPATPIDASLIQSGRWRVPVPVDEAAVPTLTPGPDGLAVSLRTNTQKADSWIMPVDGVYPLPVVNAGTLAGDVLGGPDATPQRVRSAGTVAVLPHLGRRGALVDLEYAACTARDVETATDPQVWLASDAPSGLVDKLRQAGLTVLGSTTDTDRVRYLQYQGPATGLRFHLLAAVLAVLLALAGLALVATVDRRIGWHLRALWVQGVPRPALAAANRYGYVGLVLAALLLGPLAGGVSWLLTGRSIPLFADRAQVIPPPIWPSWPVLAAGWALAGLVLLGSALTAARMLSAGLGNGGRAPRRSRRHGTFETGRDS